MSLQFTKPSPGEIVTVVTRYSSPRLNKDVDINIYENLPVIQSQNFDPPNTFRVPAINEPYITERVIALKNVERLVVNGKAGNMHQVNDQIKTFTRKGSKGNEYIITLNGDKVTCTCPGFTFRKKCRHTAEIAEQEGLNK